MFPSSLRSLCVIDMVYTVPNPHGTNYTSFHSTLQQQYKNGEKLILCRCTEVPHSPLELLVTELEEIGLEGPITEKPQLQGTQGRFLSAGELGLAMKQAIITGQSTKTKLY